MTIEAERLTPAGEDEDSRGYAGFEGICFRTFERVASGVVRFLLFSYFDVIAFGLENLPTRGPVIVAGNHPGLLDGMLLYLMSPRPLRFIVHRHLYEHRILHWVMKGLGFLPAHHGGKAVNAALRCLEKGGAIVVFPEGDVYEEGRMEEVHHGLAILARRSGVPVVPIGIAGSAEAFPLGSFWPRPFPVALNLLPPMAYPASGRDPLPVGDVVVVTADCRSQILKAVEGAEYLCKQQRRRGMRRWMLFLVSAPAFLVIVAVLTVTSPREAFRPKR